MLLVTKLEQPKLPRMKHNSAKTECPQSCIYKLVKAVLKQTPDASAVMFEDFYRSIANKIANSEDAKEKIVLPEISEILNQKVDVLLNAILTPATHESKQQDMVINYEQPKTSF